MDQNLDFEMQVSELHKLVSMKEEERDKVYAKMLTAAKVIEAIEESTKELQKLCDELHDKPNNTVSTQTEPGEVTFILRLNLVDSDNEN